MAALRTGQIHHAFIEDNKNYNLLKDEKTLTGYRSSRLGYDYLNINATRGPAQGRAGAPGHQLGGGPQPGACGWPRPASAASPRRPPRP